MKGISLDRLNRLQTCKCFGYCNGNVWNDSHDLSELVCRLIYEEKRLYIHEGVD